MDSERGRRQKTERKKNKERRQSNQLDNRLKNSVPLSIVYMEKQHCLYLDCQSRLLQPSDRSTLKENVPIQLISKLRPSNVAPFNQSCHIIWIIQGSLLRSNELARPHKDMGILQISCFRLVKAVLHLISRGYFRLYEHFTVDYLVFIRCLSGFNFMCTHRR